MFKQKSDKKVAALIAPGLEECEALIVYDLLFRAGIVCDLIAVSDSLHVTSSHNVEIVCHKLLDETKLEDYDLIFLPGGIPGTPNLEASQKIQDALASFVAKDKDIAAICAAPSILANAGYLENKNATSNPGFQEILQTKGAKVLADAPVVVDNNIITSQGMGTATELGLTLVERILGAEAKDAVKQAIVYMDK